MLILNSLDSSFHRTLDEDGFAVIPDVLSNAETAMLAAKLEELGISQSVRSRGEPYAIRNLLEVSPEAAQLAGLQALRRLTEPILGSGSFPVRAILFDKRPEANWLVPWHQDLTIAVQHKLETFGFGPWSEKAGVPHVQPPVAVMEQIVTVRVHLDDCGLDNGPVRVIPGSHRHGRLNSQQIEEWRQAVPEVTCIVPRGGALMMRPLLLHASSPAQSPVRRRVVHIEYAAMQLPNGLQWRTGIISVTPTATQ